MFVRAATRLAAMTDGEQAAAAASLAAHVSPDASAARPPSPTGVSVAGSRVRRGRRRRGASAAVCEARRGAPRRVGSARTARTPCSYHCLLLAQGRWHTPRHRAWRPAAALHGRSSAAPPAPRGDHLDAPRPYPPREKPTPDSATSRAWLANPRSVPFSALGLPRCFRRSTASSGLVRLVRGKSVVSTLTGAGPEHRVPEYPTTEAPKRSRHGAPEGGPGTRVPLRAAEAVRQRYWARSAFGWRRVRDAALKRRTSRPRRARGGCPSSPTS